VEEILAEAGRSRLSLWETFERRTKVFDDDPGGPGNTVPNPGLRTTIRRTLLDFTHAFTGSLSANLGLAFPDIRLRDETNPASPSEREFDGIGDTTLALRYAFAAGESSPHEETGRLHAHPPLFSLSAGLSFPTGEPERPTTGGPVANSTLQTGTGTFDPLVGLSYVQGWGRFSTFGSVAARFPGGENRFDFRTGTAVQASLGASVPVAEKLALVPKVSYAWQDADEIDGVDAFASGGNWLYVVPGALVRMSENADFQVAVEVPVWRNLRTEQLDTQARVTFGIGYRF
jgi:hypothetical protein